MPISEDQIFTKTKAMASLDHEVTLLAAYCSVKPVTSSIICYYEVFSKDGDIEEKIKVVQVQLAPQWSALPKCRSPVLNLEKGVKGHWRNCCWITVRFAKLSKWLDTGKYWQLFFSGCGQRTGLFTLMLFRTEWLRISSQYMNIPVLRAGFSCSGESCIMSLQRCCSLNSSQSLKVWTKQEPRRSTVPSRLWKEIKKCTKAAGIKVEVTVLGKIQVRAKSVNSSLCTYENVNSGPAPT